MASFVYNEAAKGIADSSGTRIDWLNDTIKATLINTGVTPNKDDTALSTYTSYRIGTDQTLGNKSMNKNTTDDREEFKQSTMLTWSAVAAGSTVIGIVVHKFVTNDAGSTPICYIDVTDVPTNGGDLTWTPASNIVFYLQQ